MLTEFYREALERAGVQPLQKAFDDELGTQVQSLDLVNNFRLEVFFNSGQGKTLGVVGREFAAVAGGDLQNADTGSPVPPSVAQLRCFTNAEFPFRFSVPGNGSVVVHLVAT